MSSHVALMVEAIELDERDQLLEAAAKYLEGLKLLSANMLSMGSSIPGLRSKAFGDRTRTAIQCLERLQAIHERLAANSSGHSPKEETPDRKISSELHSTNEKNQRLILQFHDTIRKKQQQSSISDAEIAKLDAQLQKKIAENVALEKHVQQVQQALLEDGKKKEKHLVRREAMRSSSSANGLSSLSGRSQTLSPDYGERKHEKSGSDTWKLRRKLSPRRLTNMPPKFTFSMFENLAIYDSDTDVPAPSGGSFVPTLEESFEEDQLSAMNDRQKKQHEVIVEFVYTERTHLRSMKVLQKLFYQPLVESKIIPMNHVTNLSVTFTDLIFANLDEIVDIHTTIAKTLRKLIERRATIDNIGDILSKYFDNDFHVKFKDAVARYCQYQQLAAEELQVRRKNDSDLRSFLEAAEMHSACRGFQLRDMLPIEFQRLSKYPLLFERLLKYADGENSDECMKLQHCFSNSRRILYHANNFKGQFENSHRLSRLQSCLDTEPFYRIIHPTTSEFRMFNLQKYNYVHDGLLKFKVDQANVELHCVLLEDLFVLLTRKHHHGDDERLQLQFYQEKISVGGKKTDPVLFSPIIKLSETELRDHALYATEFYLLQKCELVLYHFEAPSVAAKNEWYKLIQQQINKCDEAQYTEYRDSTSNESHYCSMPDKHTIMVNDEVFNDFDDEFEDLSLSEETVRGRHSSEYDTIG